MTAEKPNNIQDIPAEAFEEPKLTLETFNPKKAELTKLALEAKGLVITDHKDTAQLELVRTKRIELKKARVAITNQGKELRANAIKFQKLVLEKEGELVAIIEPEEERLQQLEDGVARKLELDRRQALLGDKKARLEALGIIMQDVELLVMSDEVWADFYNNAVARKNEADRIANEEAQAKIEADRLENERKAQELEDEKKRLFKEEQDRIAKVKQDEDDRIARLAKAEQDRLDKEEQDRIDAQTAKLKKEQDEQLQKEREEKARADERERIEREAKEKEDAEKLEQAKLEKRKVYQKFLADNGYTVETKSEFTVTNDNGVVHLYKRVATLDLN